MFNGAESMVSDFRLSERFVYDRDRNMIYDTVEENFYKLKYKHQAINLFKLLCRFEIENERLNLIIRSGKYGEM